MNPTPPGVDLMQPVPTMTPADVKLVTDALAAPFEPTEVKFKPQNVKGNRALALAYIDCRLVQDRLDEVLGVEGWMDKYEVLQDGSVMCTLRCNLGGKWVTKVDVGSLSEQPDGGDRLKAAFSDAMKRAAVKFGIGRYLYRLTAVWADYDPAKKQFVGIPQLPAFARPKPKVAKVTAPEVPTPAAVPKVAPAAGKLPASGAELHDRLKRKDAQLAKEQKCQVGALLTYVTQAGLAKGFGDDMTQWDAPAIAFATDAVKSFMQTLASEHQPAA